MGTGKSQATLHGVPCGALMYQPRERGEGRGGAEIPLVTYYYRK